MIFDAVLFEMSRIGFFGIREFLLIIVNLRGDARRIKTYMFYCRTRLWIQKQDNYYSPSKNRTKLSRIDSIRIETTTISLFVIVVFTRDSIFHSYLSI